MDRRAWRRAALPLAAVVLAACAGTAGGSGAEPGPTVVGAWELVEGTAAGAAIPLPEGGRATLTVEEDQLGGTAFCNGYGGRYELGEEGALRLSNAGATEMACEPPLMAAEQPYLEVFFAPGLRAAREGPDLVVTSDAGTLRFRPLPPVPVSDVVGTRWVLETVLREDMAGSTVGDPAVLLLDPAGKLSGSTGCRTLTGTWDASGDTLVFPELAADGECSADVRGQDDHVIAVLEDARVSVDGDRLTLTSRDGQGLVYRAG